MAKQEEEHRESVDRLIQRRSWLLPASAMSRAQGHNLVIQECPYIGILVMLDHCTDILMYCSENKTKQPVVGLWSLWLGNDLSFGEQQHDQGWTPPSTKLRRLGFKFCHCIPH